MERFSPDELYALRNHVPIGYLIEKLMVSSKISEGLFRFQCPQCYECQTVVNPKPNLSRRFRCEENFNTIDMVMTVKKTGFAENVKFLKTCLNATSDHRKKVDSVPFTIGEILREIAEK